MHIKKKAYLSIYAVSFVKIIVFTFYNLIVLISQLN